MSLSDKVIGLAQAIGQDFKVLTEQVEALASASYTDEQAQDASAAMFTKAIHTGVSVKYIDAGNYLAITNTDRGSSAVSSHEALTDPHPQYTTAVEAAAAAPVQSVNGQTGNVTVSAASVQSAVLTATQTNTTTTEATLTGHTFTIPPGRSAVITGNLIFTTDDKTTGGFYGVLVTQGAGANGNAVGSWRAYVNLSDGAADTGLADGDAFNLAGGASTPTGSGVLGVGINALGGKVTGNMSATLNCLVANNSTNVATTVQIRFRSEVKNSAVTAQIGTMAVCVVS